MQKNHTTPQTKDQPTGKNDNKDFPTLKVHNSDEILSTNFPEPVWVIKGILPVGLSVLAGAPKVGKSWLVMQIAREVAGGREVLGRSVQQGSVLYLALEDPMRRLQARMRMQDWPEGLPADFLAIGEFATQIGDLRNGGGLRLSKAIQLRGYQLVVIDTLSRAISGDQNEVAEMTSALAPLQEMAHKFNSAIILVDHHNKGIGSSLDKIHDILGSTAKGAMADTILGLYRERNKTGAKLFVTGREVDEGTISLRLDSHRGIWHEDRSADSTTSDQERLLRKLAHLGKARTAELARSLGRNRGTVHKQLAELERKGKVRQVEPHKWEPITPS